MKKQPALISALALGLLLGSVPGVTAQDQDPAPVEFTATWAWGPPIRPQTTTEVQSGVQQRGGAWRPGVLAAASSRWQGALSVASNSDDYGATGGPEVGIFAFRVQNDEGAWQQMPTVSLIVPGVDEEFDRGVFIGEGAYAGLIAVVDIVGDPAAQTWDLHGYIIGGELPPSPEPVIPE